MPICCDPYGSLWRPSTMTASAQQVTDRPGIGFYLPSLGLCLWLLFFFGLNLGVQPQRLIGSDGDSCLHWRIGAWMIDHRTVLHHDPFTHTRPDAPYVCKEWLSQVTLAAAGNAVGWQGIVLIAAALIATTLWLLHRRLMAEGADPILAVGLALLVALTCSMHWLARPHLVTHLLIVIYVWQLRAFDLGRISGRRLLLWLVPLMVLWTNLHGGFLIGLVLIAIHLIGASIDLWRAPADQRSLPRENAKVLGQAMGGCILMTLLNPNGWKLHASIIAFLFDPDFLRSVNEFRSPDFHSSLVRGFLVELLLMAMVLIVARPRLNLTEMLHVCLWTYLALHSVRNIPVFALVVTPILAGPMDTLLKSLAKTGRAKAWEFYRQLATRLTALEHSPGVGTFTIMAAAVILILILARPPGADKPSLLSTDLPTNKFPVAAVRYVQSPTNAITGNMFNPDAWGGYLLWAMPDRNVFIDSRYEFYGKELIAEYQATARVSTNWSEALDKYQVRWTLLPVGHALNQVLAVHRSWRCVYTDEVAALYRRSP